MKPAVFGLFPTPVAIYAIDRPFTKDEDDLFMHLKTVPNVKNETSEAHRILDNRLLAELRERIMDSVRAYAYGILKYDESVEFYITQSWVNYTEKWQGHHEHRHQNSIISGVLYVMANEGDVIQFNDASYRQIAIKKKSHDIFNSDTWTFPVLTGQLILFPSYAMHEVPTKTTEGCRVSLSFNVFVRGMIGDASGLTELKI